MRVAQPAQAGFVVLRRIYSLHIMPKSPQRTCCACGAKKSPREMRRIASQKGAAPTIDPTGHAPGRGAYLCHDAQCVEKALGRKSLERALKLHNPLPEEFKTQLRAANQ
jgi:predicted RNA-binding protein YlxR (DUF448 family)